jgi:hypothetical protein
LFVGKSNEDLMISKSFEGSKVSLRLLMFQAYFLTNVARIPGKSISKISQEYDKRFGHPTSEQKEMLQNAIFKIQKVNNYVEFFRSMNVQVTKSMKDILKISHDNSVAKGYHKVRFGKFSLSSKSWCRMLDYVEEDSSSTSKNLEKKEIMEPGWENVPSKTKRFTKINQPNTLPKEVKVKKNQKVDQNYYSVFVEN